MPLEMQDMSLHKGAVPLSGLRAALKTLIDNIVGETNGKVYHGKTTDYFFNHAYDRDPSTNGGPLGLGVNVKIYYQPATDVEYNNWEVIDGAGCLSGRRRLAVRIESNKASFWMTNHPKEKPGLRTNVYGLFTPINPAT